MEFIIRVDTRLAGKLLMTGNVARIGKEIARQVQNRMYMSFSSLSVNGRENLGYIIRESRCSRSIDVDLATFRVIGIINGHRRLQLFA